MGLPLGLPLGLGEPFFHFRRYIKNVLILYVLLVSIPLFLEKTPNPPGFTFWVYLWVYFWVYLLTPNPPGFTFLLGLPFGRSSVVSAIFSEVPRVFPRIFRSASPAALEVPRVFSALLSFPRLPRHYDARFTRHPSSSSHHVLRQPLHGSQGPGRHRA